MRWIGERTGPIGLDLGSRRAKAVQLKWPRGGAGKARVAAAASVERSPEAGEWTVGEVRRLVDVLYRHGFTGTEAIVAVPAGKLLSGILELPPRTANAPYEQMARLEFARHQKVDPQSFEMAYWDLPTPARASKTNSVMAVGCKYADAEALLAPFDAVGLDVLSLDTQSCATARACAPLLNGLTGVTGILDLGWRSASLVLVHHGVIVYDRPLTEGGIGGLYRTLEQSLGIKAEAADVLLPEHGMRGARAAEGKDEGQRRSDGALAEVAGLTAAHFDHVLKDLEMSFTYAEHQYGDEGVERLLLVGGGAGLPGLAEHWSEVTGVEVRAVGPADLVECAPAVLSRCGAGYTTALGLAQGVGQ